MPENKKIFDAEFEIGLLQIDNNFLRKRIDLEEKYNRWAMWITLGYIFITSLIGSFHDNAQDKKIVKLQEDVALTKCELDATKHGAGFSFIAKGDKSECITLYSE